MTPVRVQRRRAAGWTAPLDHLGRKPIYVGRGSRWGNPHVIVLQADGLYGIPPEQPDGDWPTFSTAVEARREAAQRYETWLAEHPWMIDAARRQLAGRNLMCWCPEPEPGEPDHCHAAVLLRLANEGEP
jgi:hypothetical protein